MKNYKHIKVDLSNCDREPIQLIGRIQGHGFLFVVNPGFEIEQISDNISSYTGLHVNELLNKSLESVLGEDHFREIKNAIEIKRLDSFLFKINNKEFFGYTYVSGDRRVFEAEPFERDVIAPSANDFFLKRIISELDQSKELYKKSKIVATRIQEFINYDRVMIYKFDEDWHGHVIAECVKPGVNSYFNHHFPATDIPSQARTMLLEKRMRQIPDVNHAGADIVPYINPNTGKPTELLKSDLRNPSEIHLEYLKNMDVQATFSIAIVADKQLWGIVACQNEKPIFVDHFKRNICDLIVRYYAQAIRSATEKTDDTLQEKVREFERFLVIQMEEGLNIAKALFQESVTILDVCQATGATLCLEEKVISIGKTPAETEITEILKWARTKEIHDIYYTREFSKELFGALEYKDIGSGLVIVEISRLTDEYLFLFKPEIKVEVSWAGNPSEAKSADATLKLHPRKSFQKYIQVVEGKSDPWTSLELQAVRSLRKTIVSIHLKCQAEKLKKLNQKLNDQNSQLEDFAYLASHNLLAPLNNIHSLLAFHKGGYIDKSDALNKVETVAKNMKQTLMDFHVLLKVSSPDQIQKTNLDIEEIINKEKENLSAQIGLSKIEINTDLLIKKLEYSKVFMESLIHNLLSNAIKYRAVDRQPQILIKTYKKVENVILEVSDNGLGIDLERNKDKIFGLYKTFHQNQDSRGLGLYLIKKQIESLGGKIQVESKVGVGTTFRVEL